MDARGIRGGIASGGGVCVELEGNALLGSANDLGSIPVVDGRRFVGYDFFFDSFNKPAEPEIGQTSHGKPGEPGTKPAMANPRNCAKS